MIPSLDSLAIWLGDFYLLSTVLLVIALMVGLALHQPTKRLAVIKATLVALGILAALCALPRWSVVHLRTAEQFNSTSSANPQAATFAAATSTPNENVKWPANTAAIPLPVAEPTSDAETALAAGKEITWQRGFVVAYVAGTIGVFGWLVVGQLAAIRLRRHAQPAPAELIAMLEEVATRSQVSPKLESTRGRVSPRLGCNESEKTVAEVGCVDGATPLIASFGDTGVHVPQLLICDRIAAPVAVGLFHPAILLPNDFADKESAIHNPNSAIHSILAHELAHIRNHDLAWLAVSRVLLVLLWAQPLYWLVRRRMRFDQETLADAAAAELTSRQQYAEQLVAWARRLSTQPLPVRLSPAVGLWEGASQLRQRVAMLVNANFSVLRVCSRRWRIAAATIVLGVTAVLSVVTVQPGRTAPTAEPIGKQVPKSIAQTTGSMSIRFEYDGIPTSPTELKEWIWRTKLDDRELRRINIEKEVGAKVFDESLVVGNDHGIANVFVWVRSRDIPPPETANELRPITLSYRKGRYEPHALAFQAPCQLILRNDDLQSTCGFIYAGMNAKFGPLVNAGEEKKADVRPEKFPVHVTGNIREQAWLSAWVFPIAHPYIAVSDKHGVARIENLPPGKWEFQTWHERSGWVMTKQWPRGRFTLEVKPGENDLGTVKLPPLVFKVPVNQPKDD